MVRRRIAAAYEHILAIACPYKEVGKVESIDHARTGMRHIHRNAALRDAKRTLDDAAVARIGIVRMRGGKNNTVHIRRFCLRLIKNLLCST